jgi:hypothetical protein
MLKTASTEVKTPDFITTAIRRNQFNHSHLQLSLSYISIIHIVSGFARKKIRRKKIFLWHTFCLVMCRKLLIYKHLRHGGRRIFVVSPYVSRVCVESTLWGVANPGGWGSTPLSGVVYILTPLMS